MKPNSLSFWKINMYEHTVILYDTLSPMEHEAQTKARQYFQLFQKYIDDKKTMDIHLFIRDVNSFQQFLIQLLRKQVTTGLKILLTPTFLSHLITESNMALRFASEKIDPSPLASHLTWLLVLSGDAFTIQGALDSLERSLVTKYLHYADLFEKQYVFAIELKGIMRIGLTEFPALLKFQEDTKRLVVEFIESLNQLEILEAQNSILDKLPLFFVQHIKREAQYYLSVIPSMG
ncbi:DUF2935 domain-containing protein [Bacillus sp. 31A1R]|uniref:DUF2935 domain-containing protein n=1 Tax=Robertmurraya mangrovi TaxID=3098077 RepID=A0ABU5J0M7_9BACI|nr:DUF2935 domain-containing protein [Bacillus sp. 31A1R]MDZ5472900.1 DUF2935 domain-containing protein [Bacillus sp. 31A1R]